MRRLIPLSIASLWLCLFWAGPVPAQEAAPGTPELFKEIHEILADLAQITGWKAPKKVDSDTITKDGLKQFLEDRMKEIVKPEEVRAEEVTLKKLGLVPESFDLKKSTVDLLTEQAAAFYDYRKKKLFVLDTNATITQRPVLVHELAHALADSHVNLEKYIFKGKSDDAAMARQSVMEGQATWLMSEYVLFKMGNSLKSAPEMVDVMNRMAGSSGGMFPVFDSAPLYLRESLMFPYTKGFTFNHAVILKLGQAAFVEVYKNPPQSSQQIIHPEKYFAKVQPTKPVLPKADVKGLSDLVEGSIGEFDHSILFRQYGSEKEAVAAEKLRGAWFKIYESKKDKRALLLYASEWEDAAAARAAFALYRKVIEGKNKKAVFSKETGTSLEGIAGGVPFQVRLDETRLTSVE